MKYAIYQNPFTHQFAIVRVPPRFQDGDKLPLLNDERWFTTREAAIAALPELLNRDE